MSASSTIEVIRPAYEEAQQVRKLTTLEISRTISLARIVLIVGLVFLHYLKFPNSPVWPYTGLDPNSHSIATFVNSGIHFLFLSAVPLLSMISGWLFFTFDDNNHLKTVHRRIINRFSSVYLPLVFWNAVFLTGLYAIYETNMHHPNLMN